MYKKEREKNEIFQQIIRKVTDLSIFCGGVRVCVVRSVRSVMSVTSRDISGLGVPGYIHPSIHTYTRYTYLMNNL